MGSNEDTWARWRSRQTHLTDSELESLRQDFLAGVRPREAARKIKCSSRIAYKYFKIFRDTDAAPIKSKSPFGQRPRLRGYDAAPVTLPYVAFLDPKNALPFERLRLVDERR